MKKLALILPNNIWVSPYVNIYTRLLDTLGVDYELISWNREGREEPGIQYQKCEKSHNIIKVLWAYICFAKFVKKVILSNQFERIIVFSPQVALFLASFLERHYKGRYIFDYRDLSLEQKPFLAKRFKKVLSNSYANIISSPGFKQYLPKGFNYIISHNFNAEIVKKAIKDPPSPYEGKDMSVLTIGAIRTDMNPEVIDALGNAPGFHLSFVGKGISAEYLEKYAKHKGYNNIEFSGYYNKNEESDIIRRHAFINIVYPLIPSHISALSNRFYNSLIYKRPMIVTRNTAQGQYASKYDVGIVIDNCDHLAERIIDYKKKLDFKKYVKQCNQLLDTFLDENKQFESKISEFVKA